MIRPLSKGLATAMALALGHAGCDAARLDPVVAAAVPAPSSLSYPVIDPDLGEVLSPRESEIAEQIGRVIEESLRTDYGPWRVRRDAHPKAHGCVKAQFHVLEGVPASLSSGMFLPGKTYQAWIRFSNGSRDATRADSKGDARGMAIKVLGVPGRKLLEAESDSPTQDFILINHPVFFANDPTRYLALTQHATSDSTFSKLLIPFDLGVKGSRIALETSRKKISNPLQTRYWSMVPYQLGSGPGRQAVKYSVRACDAKTDPMPDDPADNFLRDALRTTLQNRDACMEFLVQPRASAGMDVEDSMTEWSEAEAAFAKVATIRIPQQTFDTTSQNEFCENLSFSPWHSLPEHKPLGATNRLRKVIYERISQFRHEMNAPVRTEPR